MNIDITTYRLKPIHYFLTQNIKCLNNINTKIIYLLIIFLIALDKSALI